MAPMKTSAMAAEANAANLEDIYTCSICYEIFKTPRRLPACPHVYCQDCLVRMERNLVIICPQCRMENILPAGGVHDLQIDLNIKRLVESIFGTEDDDEGDNVTARRGSRDLGTIMNGLQKKLPSAQQMQMLASQKAKWKAFKDHNRNLKEEVDHKLAVLIRDLQNKRIEILNKFVEYDRFAEERISWIHQTLQAEIMLREINSSVKDINSEGSIELERYVKTQDRILSKTKDLVNELVPGSLGSVHTGEFHRVVKHIGRHITRRTPGLDPEIDLLFQGQGQICTCPNGLPTDVVAMGRIEVRRKRGGSYQMVVRNTSNGELIDKYNWNNRRNGEASIVSQVFYHVPWTLRNGQKERAFSTVILDHDSREQFLHVIQHAALTEKTI